MTRTDIDSIFPGLSIFKNQESPYYHCRIFVEDNKHIVSSTKEKTKIKARKVAKALYLEMKTNKEIGVPKNRTFKYFANELLKQGAYSRIKKFF